MTKIRPTVFIPIVEDSDYIAYVKMTPLTDDEQLFFKHIGDNTFVTELFIFLLDNYSKENEEKFLPKIKSVDSQFTGECLIRITENREEWKKYTIPAEVNKILRAQNCDVYLDKIFSE
jgi:hypothetical protein